MKYHVVFEVDADPGVSFMDVTAMTQLSAVSFNKAVSPLGTCKLDAIKKVDSRELTGVPVPDGQGDFGIDETAEIAHTALDMLLNEGEWHTEHWTGAQGHNLVCLTCGVSLANTVPGYPDAKHHDGCKRAALFVEARRLGLLKEH